VATVPDLYITPTRRQLLQDIERGLVYVGMDGEYYVPAPATQSGRFRVTASVQELARAGLAVEPGARFSKVTLTAAGRKATKGGGSDA
jgi:hypothetical protein